MGWFQIEKGIQKGCILSPCLLNFYAEYITWNARLDESQAGINTARRNINNLRYADDTTLMTESEEKLKCLLMRVKEESEKAGLNLNIQKTKMIEFGPITSWQVDGGKSGNSDKFYFSWAPKLQQMVTATMKLTDIFSLEGKVWQHIKKQRHHFADRSHIVKARVFPLLVYGCDGWTIKKAEHWRIDAFELWCWIRLLRLPWTARKSTESILKEISPEYSLEGLMLRLKL